MKPGYALSLAAVLLFAVPAVASAEDVPGQVIVQFKSRASATARGDTRRAADVGVVRGMRRTGQQLVKVQSGQTVTDAVRELERDPDVSFAQPNHVYHAAAVPNDPLFGQLWGQLNSGQAVFGTPGVAGTAGADIDAQAAWDRTTGSRNIIVAVTDTGIAYDHPDLAANMWNNPADPPGGGDNDGNGIVDDVHGADFCGANGGAGNPCAGPVSGDPRDLNEHGTHVSGTIGAVGNNGIGVAGVNWQVSLMAVRVLNAVGSGSSAAIADGFDYAGDHGARVVNASLSGGGSSDPAEQAAIDAHPNTLYVVAAGNNNTDNDVAPRVPCNLPDANQNLVCVAATTQTDALASFSNRGAASVDLGAPGTNVLSTFPSYDGFRDGFEAGNLNNWVADPPWGLVSGVAAGGSFSVTDSPAGNYQPGLDVSLRTASAVTLSGGTCRVSYDARRDTELGNDGIFVETSPTGAAPWTNRGSFSGNSGGQFLAGSTDLPSGTLFVRFRFHSDGDMNVGDGVYLDNIRIGCIDGTYDGNEYGFLDGTSMASPQVAGAAALALSLAPGTSTAALKAALLSSGDPDPALQGITVSGRRLNVASLLNTISPVQTPTTPTPGPIPAPAPPPLAVKTLRDVKVGRCKQSGSGKRRRLKCTLRNLGVVRSASLTLKKGRTTVAKGTAKPKSGALALKLKHKLRKGKYVLTLVLRDAAGRKRTVKFSFRVR
jgi:subtilisin family serine protease